MKKLFLSLIPLLFLAIAAEADPGQFKSGVFNPPRLAPEFTMQSSQGGEFKLKQTRGKLVVLGFGFTHCADVCPVTLAKLAQVRKKLGDLANEMQVVYITVDPANDPPARMKEYLGLFDPSFIGATGTDAQLAAVQDQYGIVATKATSKEGETQYHHSSYLYLIDHNGYLRVLVPFGKTADDIVHDIKLLLTATPHKKPVNPSIDKPVEKS